MTTELTSTEAAERLDIPSETLRYWERAGLIDRITRDQSQRRRYTNGDLEFIDVIRCLRLTGMPIRDVRRFADLVRSGESTIPQRLAMLRAHADRVRANIEAQERALVVVGAKVERYESLSAESPSGD